MASQQSLVAYGLLCVSNVIVNTLGQVNRVLGSVLVCRVGPSCCSAWTRGSASLPMNSGHCRVLEYFVGCDEGSSAERREAGEKFSTFSLVSKARGEFQFRIFHRLAGIFVIGRPPLPESSRLDK